MKKSLPIGLFDSGIGGLTVMKQLIQKLPHESMIYFGDTARLPYGEKSPDTILRYSKENAERLINKGIKLLVIPCNTSTAYALDMLKETLSVPVIGVIEPGARKAAQITRNQRIAILGTRALIKSKVCEEALLRHVPHAALFPVACPLFVPLIEEQFLNHPITSLVVKEYVKPLCHLGIDTVLLACTHYPLLRHAIQEALGPSVAIVDSATSCAEEVASKLRELRLEASSSEPKSYKYYVSDDPESFRIKGSAFLDCVLHDVHLD